MDVIICVECGLAFDIESGEKVLFLQWVKHHSHGQKIKKVILHKAYGNYDIVEAGPLIYGHTIIEWEWCGLINTKHKNGEWHYHEDTEAECNDRKFKPFMTINGELRKVTSEKYFLKGLIKDNWNGISHDVLNLRIDKLSEREKILRPKALIELVKTIPELIRNL